MSFSLSYSYSPPDSSFYPLNQIGNEWEYSPTIQTNTYKERVTDTIRVNDILYYKLLIENINQEYFIRELNNKVFILNLSDSSESILLDFSANIGDNWQVHQLSDCFWGSGITLISKNDTVVTPIDTFYNCCKFSHEAQCADAGILFSWYSKGIGKVKQIENYIWGNDTYSLKKYNLITGVDDNNLNLGKLNFSLYQNYPNPFNPTTKIKYSIPESENVEIKIFDILGNEVRNLVNEYKIQGVYEIDYDATNLSSGIYLYRIISGKYLEAKKMLLLR